MTERHHTYEVLGWEPGGWRYAISKDGQRIETSKPFSSRELAITNGNERACELDDIWD